MYNIFLRCEAMPVYMAHHGVAGSAFYTSRGTPEMQRANATIKQPSSLAEPRGNSSHPGPGTCTSYQYAPSEDSYTSEV